MATKNIGETDMELNRAKTSASQKDAALFDQKKPSQVSDEQKTDEDGERNELLMTFARLSDNAECEKFLEENSTFITAETALALLQLCGFVAEENEKRITEPETSFAYQNLPPYENLTRQTKYILYLIDISKDFGIDPMHCVEPFFKKMREEEFSSMFEKEVETFQSNIKKMSLEELILCELLNDAPTSDDESETGSKQGDGPTPTIDPFEVYINLPANLRKCLDEENMEELVEELKSLPEEEGNHYMTQFIESGLFLPIDKEESSEGDTSSDEKSGSESERDQPSEGECCEGRQ